MKKILLALVSLAQTIGCATSSSRAEKPAEDDPLQLYGGFFEHVQLAPVFDDSKYFVDMTPIENPNVIMARFNKEQPATKENLRNFVSANFLPPDQAGAEYKSAPGDSIDQHIKTLWKVLKRKPHGETRPAASLISLPYSYVVPGGRFREIYYWDSYFTMLGLLADHEDELFRDMVKNFEHLLLTLGRIPNGNRDYYRGRSQPPFFSHMVELWQTRFGERSAARFLPALKKEHEFWMSGSRAVHLNEGEILNRYWDDFPKPRPEAFKEDRALASEAVKIGRAEEDVYRDLRAGAESGWDYSTRWFTDPKTFATVQTTSFIPVDLNSLLYHLEMKISELSRVAGAERDSQHYKDLAGRRAELVRRYLWDPGTGIFHDYNWRLRSRSPERTVATVVPLFTGVATATQAQSVARVLERDFLKAGGLVTTLRASGQQWDAPNGWPPHQWMGYQGLKRYNENALASRLRKRWLALNRRVFRDTGKMVEKYNVIDPRLKSGGGEYPLQDGFGWTNGVYRAMSADGRG